MFLAGASQQLGRRRVSGTRIGRGEERKAGASCGQTAYFIILTKSNTNPSHQ